MLSQKLNRILLIDDDPNCNFLHRRLLRKTECSDSIVVQEAGEEALHYLSTSDEPPELIFLDLNMPGMSGWEFIEAFKKLPPRVQERAKVMILTSSLNPDDQERAADIDTIRGMYDKLLSRATLEDIFRTHFPEKV